MILGLLKSISKELESRNIPYMLSGSIALNNYCVPRMTVDIDIVIELYEEKLSEFLSIFDENFYYNAETVKSETKKHGIFNIIDHETGFKIDFILRKESDYRQLEFLRRTKVKIEDIEVWIVTPEDLVISKIDWIQHFQSEKQITDIKNLLAISGIEKKYILDWCQKLSLNTFNLI